MKSRAGWQGKVTIWAGWLLGVGLLLVLAVWAMTLSTDGARLKRLFAGRPDVSVGAPEAVIASYEPVVAGDAAAPGVETPRPSPLVGPLEASAVPSAPSKAAAVVLGSGGCVRAEVIGPSKSVEVLLDGEWKGTAPVLIDQVEPGLHRLTFQSGSVNWDEQVRVSAGDTTVVACVAPDELLSASSAESTPASPSSNP
jgi:hypothetical protein